MNHLSYWKQQWEKACSDYICHSNSTKDNIKMWDGYANTYDDDGYKKNVDTIIEYLSKEGYLNKNAAILDVGCGTGRYTLPMSKRCNHVDAMDFSTNMLKETKRKLCSSNANNVTLVSGDWNALDLKDEGMEKKYDLVFSSLNPACYSADSLMKLTGASKGHCCFIGTDSKGSSKILDEADAFVIGEKAKRADVSNIIYPFNILYFQDYTPKVFYSDCDLTYKRTQEQAVGKLIERYKNYQVPNKSDKIKDFVQQNLQDGFWVENVITRLGVVTWKAHKQSKECYAFSGAL